MSDPKRWTSGMRLRLNGEERDFMADEVGRIDYEAIRAWWAREPCGEVRLMTVYSDKDDPPNERTADAGQP